MAHEPTDNRELEKRNDDFDKVKSRATAAQANVKLLNISLANHKKGAPRLTTEVAAAKANVAEFEVDETSADNDFSTVLAAVQKVMNAVYYLKGQLSNLTR